MFGFGIIPSCFSAVNTVNVQNVGPVPMRKLSIGDYVESSPNTYSRVISFSHLDHQIAANYLSVHADDGKILEISAEHMVMVNEAAVAARDLKVGDAIGSTTITKIEDIRSIGAYAPVTEAGTIMVSGLPASSYIAVVDKVSTELQQSVYHNLYAPLRFVCGLSIDFCQAESYSSGISGYLTDLVTVQRLAKSYGADRFGFYVLGSLVSIFDLRVAGALAVAMIVAKMISARRSNKVVV